MPLAISDIIKQAAIELGLQEPSGTIVTSTNPQIKRLVQAAVQTGRDLRANYFYPQLKKLHTFTTTTSVQYPLPSDFFKMIPGAQWDTTNNWRMGGPLDDPTWYLFQYGTVSSLARTLFYIAGYDTLAGQFQVNPDPEAGHVLAYPYIRSQWFFPLAWTEGEIIAGAGEYRSSAGNIYVSDGAGTTGATAPDWTTGSDSDGGVNWTFVPTQTYGAGEKFAADTDFCLVDDDLFIMGVKYFYLQSKGMDYAAEEALYKRTAQERQIRMTSAPILNMADNGLNQWLGYDNIPEGDYG